MLSRYAQWMYDWEHRLTSVDDNRVVRPLEWGVEWARDWPYRNGFRNGQEADDPEKFFLDLNRHILATSDEFYSYVRPTDFRLENREVKVFSTRSGCLTFPTFQNRDPISARMRSSDPGC